MSTCLASFCCLPLYPVQNVNYKFPLGQCSLWRFLVSWGKLLNFASSFMPRKPSAFLGMMKYTAKITESELFQQLLG